MRRYSVLRNILVIGLLVLVSTNQVGVVSAGTNIRTGNGPEGGEVWSLAIDPQSLATLYAGTDIGGVFKSTNGGDTWAFSGLINETIFSIVIDPQSPQTLYAEALDGLDLITI
jgi:hypothetical protein